jgi:PKD repeat protein
MTRKTKHLTGQKFLRQATGAVANLAAAAARGSRTSRRADKPVVETLEQRQLMAASVGVGAEEALWVRGDESTPNLLTVRLADDGTSVAVNANGQVTYHALDAITSIRVRGGDARDVIYVDPRIRKSLHIMSGDGRDTVFAPADRGRRGDARDIVALPSRGDAAVAALERQARDARRADGLKVASFSLINADTNEVIADFDSLGDGVTLNLATLPTRNLNIRANLAGDAGGSVVFSLNGGATRVENAIPFAMMSDTNGDFFNWTPSTGSYTLVATPYTRDHAKGLAGEGRTLTFNVVNRSPGRPSNNTGGDGDEDTTGGSDDNDNEVPTPDPDPTPNPRPDPSPPPTEPDDTDDVAAPDAIIELISNSVEVGHAIHANAMRSVLKAGDVLRARYEWDFGDRGSEYNTLVGFNAAHLYERAGTYTITLKVTNSAGKSTVARTTVTIKPSTRRVIYVSQDGNDWNTGFSPDEAIQSWDRARSMAGDDTEIRFRRGDTWNITTAKIGLGYHNVVIGAYGTGARPSFRWTQAIDSDAILSTKDGRDVTIRDVRFDSNAVEGVGLYGVSVGGVNISVVGCEFGTIGFALNTNHIPRGVLAMDNVATERLRSYFSWVQGTDHVYLGNKAELKQDNGHVMRFGTSERVLVAFNDFTKPVNEPGVTMRGTITLSNGKYVYLHGNSLHHGKVTTGPLSNLDANGVGRDMEDRAEWIVFEANRINSSVYVKHGTSHVAFRDNLLMPYQYQAIEIQGYHDEWKRGVDDVYIVDNTVIHSSTQGHFLIVREGVEQVTLSGNLYLAPKMTFGERETAAVIVTENDLSAFREISGNVWPSADPLAISGGGFMYIGPDYSDAGLITTGEWEGFRIVEGDMFQDVQLTSVYRATVGGTTAGANLPMAA